MSELLALVDAESLKMLLAIFVVLALSSWVGSVIGRQQRKQNPAKDEGIKIVLGATLSLFGLLIGFLLSFAISGYNTRVSAEEHEAMALANAFQRTTLLPTTEAQAQAEANVQALTAELGRQGLSPERVQQQLMLALAQLQQAAQVQSEQPVEGAAA